jgi:hypothetical protein
MAFDFNIEDPLAEEAPQQTRETVADFEEQFSEAERRFARAQYYRALLSESIFGDDNSQNATEVVEEIRGFIRSRLAVLLGVKVEPVQKAESVFTDEELQVLKAVCSKVLKKPSLIQEPAKAPVLKKVEAPQKPKVKATQSPVATQPKMQAPAPKASSAPKPAPVTTSEKITVDNKTYTKILMPNGDEFWQDRGGNRYMIGTNDEGKHYFKSLNVQARPPPGVKMMPKLNHQMKLMMAANQAADGIAKMESRLERRENGMGDNAPPEAQT